MQWIAPTEKDTAAATLEKRLWDAADQFRANSGLKSQEYSAPVLGLIFLRFAEVRFTTRRGKLEQAGASSRRGSRVSRARCRGVRCGEVGPGRARTRGR
jgi:type I restriction enzyme M protein